MPDVEEVHITGPTASHWVVSGPLGKTVQWDPDKQVERAVERFRKLVETGGLGPA